MFPWKKQKNEVPAFPSEDYEPVIRCSICTGEKVACMRNRHTGRLQEISLLREPEDLAAFCRAYHIEAETIKTVY